MNRTSSVDADWLAPSPWGESGTPSPVHFPFLSHFLAKKSTPDQPCLRSRPRGPRVFEVRSREDLRWLHPGHLIVRDVDGNRYEIKRFDDLDSTSRLKIEGYL